MSEIETRKIKGKIYTNEIIYSIYGQLFLLFELLKIIQWDYQTAVISIFIFVIAMPSNIKNLEKKLKIKIPEVFIFSNMFLLTAALYFPAEGVILSLITIFIFLLDLLRKLKRGVNLIEYPSEASTSIPY